jgi:hypothetical protein
MVRWSFQCLVFLAVLYKMTAQVSVAKIYCVIQEISKGPEMKYSLPLILSLFLLLNCPVQASSNSEELDTSLRSHNVNLSSGSYRANIGIKTRFEFN